MTCRYSWVFTHAQAFLLSQQFKKYKTSSFPTLDILVSLLDCAPELQNRVSVLCEGWWCGGREGREELMPNTLLYVIARTLTEGATVSSQTLNTLMN